MLVPSPVVQRLLALVLVAAFALPTSAVAQDLDAVEREVDQLAERLDAATAAYEETWAKVESAEAELANLQARATELEAEAAAVAGVLAERARLVYKYGSDTVLSSLLSADGPQGAVERASMMALVTARSEGRLEQSVSLRQNLDQVQVLLEKRNQELDGLLAQLDGNRDALNSELNQMQALAVDLRERAERQRQISEGRMRGIYSCIHDYNSFRDTWGAPRSGGRAHKGVDVMAPYDVPVYAFTNGRISRLSQGGLGGINLYLWGDDGNEYFYAHLSGYASTTYVGKRVEAGELIAYNGDTGNARGTPHVHFEVHPGGGSPVNPYPFMLAACR